jgi:hypothetical protein
MAQGVGPEFRSQHCKEREKEERERERDDKLTKIKK